MDPLAQIIQTHRKKAGLAQAQLAKLAGVGKTVVWDLEHGKESVQWDTLQKIFRVLNITIEWHSPLLQRTASTPSSSKSAPSTSSPSVAMSPAAASTRSAKSKRSP